MATNRKYKSDAYEAIHSSVAGMYRAGTIDKATMREFDEACLSVPTALEPRRIKQIRLSQRSASRSLHAISIPANLP